MKKIISKLMGGVLLFSLSMSLTSCEGALDDIFGHWERPSGNSNVAVTSVELNESMIVVNVGATSMSLTGIVSPANATDKTITWKSSNPSVATVDENGLVSFVGHGSAIITATADGIESSCEVIVNNPVDLATKTADFEVQDCEALSGTLNVSTTPIKVTVADGATVTLENMTIEGVHGTTAEYKHAGLSFEGDGTLILRGVNIVKGFNLAYPGIHVKPGKTLTIKGDGKLTASSGEKNGTDRYGSGIGGGYEIACGNIVIESGTIIADGGKSAAGIGGGNKGACGDITIHGGDITATNEGYGGAVIGCTGFNAIGGDITITGGKITAEVKGNNLGIGIGSGSGELATIGKITISGGDITATGGIGAYDQGKCGDIDISGGKIVATSCTDCAGIGAGYGFGTGSSICGNITISGGDVTAIGGKYAAGIGTGRCQTNNDNSKCGNITITDGVTQVTATKGANAVNSIGIGYTMGTCGTITIAPGANVTQN